MSSFNTIAISLAGGVLPAMLWLWFWLKEDRLHPEPRARILTVFLTGMASVFLVLPIEKLIFSIFSNISLITVLFWASTEEIIKFIAAYFSALRKKEMDEPIDAIIYMITIALGFSALENSLFLFNLVEAGSLSQSIITSNSRFLGATLLHIASSATVGVMVGLSFYKKPVVKRLFLYTGLILAIVLHAIFNLLIIKLENSLFLIFAGVWVLIVLLLVLIEKIKNVKR